MALGDHIIATLCPIYDANLEQSSEMNQRTAIQMLFDCRILRLLFTPPAATQVVVVVDCTLFAHSECAAGRVDSPRRDGD